MHAYAVGGFVQLDLNLPFLAACGSLIGHAWYWRNGSCAVGNFCATSKPAFFSEMWIIDRSRRALHKYITRSA